MEKESSGLVKTVTKKTKMEQKQKTQKRAFVEQNPWYTRIKQNN